MYNSSTKRHEGTWIWLFKIVAGLLIVVLLGIHFIVNHLVAPEGLLSYADVVAYYQNPIIPIMEIVFLALAVSHSLIGIRSIILDLNPSDKTMRSLDVAFIILGLGATLYGIWLVLVIVGRGV